MEQCIYACELYHHGIKGMRWGIRRFQKKDGTLTTAGKKRYNESEGSTGDKKKSKHRIKLENRYLNEGMTKENAELMANRRIKTEKVLGTIAGVTVVAASAYLVNKHVKERTDQIIKAGESMQRIEGQKKIFGSKDRNLHESFYVTNNEYDNKHYYDVFGYTKKKNHGNAYKLDIEAKSDIKIASQKKARDTLKDLMYNNEDFKNSLDYNYNIKDNLRQQNRIPKKHLDKIKNGQKVPERIMQKIYDNYNSNLVGKPINSDESKNRTIFYDALKKQGYSGVQDITDLKWSHLRGKNPLIIFDKGKTAVKSIENITDKVNSKASDAAYKQMGKLRGKQAVAKSLPKIAGLSTAALIGYRNDGVKLSKNSKKFIKYYKKDHPNTELSDREIMQMYYGDTNKQ